ncbi:MAG: helix-turn-helix transcriptional regulator [Planctomycetaceae bacterium]|nr:helix-turn-helix transcriptional regulator [Planctomycetaceae bacterium]
MFDPSLNVRPELPAIRHQIRGMHHVDAAVCGIEILMHRYVCLEEWSLVGATNAFWRLYWPESSGGSMRFQKTDYPLDPGSLYLISPHTAFDSHCSRPYAKWYLHFNTSGLPGPCRLGIETIRPTPRMRKLLTETCPVGKQFHASEQHSHRPLETLELLLLVLQEGFPRFQLTANPDDRLERCVTYLQDHLKEKVTLAQLARFAGVSPRTLSWLFKSELGFPPMRYLIELRLNRAMKLLRHTDCSIEQIAEDCGFPNRYYFTRMLSRYRKTTPAAFRVLSPGTD